jgi:class 3 adenylate cyclase
MSTHAFLSNMLPAMVFEGLKREDSALVAHERPAASVLFSDIVGFTSIAATLKPEDVVAVLNVMFSIFDTLSQKHLVYKVETIGDAYVACTNVVLQRDDHAKCLVDFALAMQKATKRMYTPSHQQIVIRVGLHTGSVVAGVVGRKMPRYHLFGETVTIAELMEQKGVPGMVALSHACYSAMPASTVTTEYECKPLEPVPHEQHMVKRYTIERAKGYPASIPAGDQFSMKTGRDRRASIKGGTARTPHQSLHTLHGSNGLGLTSSQIDLLQQPISPPAPLTPLPADDSSESASPPHHGVLAVTVTTESTTDREGEKSEDSGSAKDMKGTAAIAPLLASPSVQVTVARTGHGRGDSIAFSPPAHTKTPSAPSPVFLPGQLDEDINLPE